MSLEHPWQHFRRSIQDPPIALRVTISRYGRSCSLQHNIHSLDDAEAMGFKIGKENFALLLTSVFEFNPQLSRMFSCGSKRKYCLPNISSRFRLLLREDFQHSILKKHYPGLNEHHFVYCDVASMSGRAMRSKEGLGEATITVQHHFR